MDEDMAALQQAIDEEELLDKEVPNFFSTRCISDKVLKCMLDFALGH